MSGTLRLDLITINYTVRYIKVSVNVIAEYILAGQESKVRVSVKVIPCDDDCIMFTVVNKLRANTVRFPSSNR